MLFVKSATVEQQHTKMRWFFKITFCRLKVFLDLVEFLVAASPSLINGRYYQKFIKHFRLWTLGIRKITVKCFFINDKYFHLDSTISFCKEPNQFMETCFFDGQSSSNMALVCEIQIRFWFLANTSPIFLLDWRGFIG